MQARLLRRTLSRMLSLPTESTSTVRVCCVRVSAWLHNQRARFWTAPPSHARAQRVVGVFATSFLLSSVLWDSCRRARCRRATSGYSALISVTTTNQLRISSDEVVTVDLHQACSILERAARLEYSLVSCQTLFSPAWRSMEFLRH